MKHWTCQVNERATFYEDLGPWIETMMKPMQHDFNTLNYSSLYGTSCNDSLDRPRVPMLQNYDLSSSHGPKKWQERETFFSLSLKAKLHSFLHVIAIIRIVIGAVIDDLIFKWCPTFLLTCTILASIWLHSLPYALFAVILRCIYVALQC